MKKKVLFTASTYSHINHFHLPYLQEFKERGWIVHVGCGGAVAEIDHADAVFHIPFEKKMTSPQNFAAASQLRRIMREERYDLVCTHTSLAAFFTRLSLWGMKNRPRVVNVVHGYLFDDKSSFLKRSILLWAEKMTARQTDLLLAMNEWDFKMAQRCQLGKRVSFIPGIGVDFSRFDRAGTSDDTFLRDSLGISDEAFVLMYAAEFSKRKSQETLIRSMTYLPENVVMILAGDGDLRKDCEELADTLEVRDRVHFPGYVTNVSAWYRNVDAVVSSSRSEGLPFNIMEALYLGKPVIASAVKGHEDLIDSGRNGVLFPYGDPDACAEAILRVLEGGALNKMNCAVEDAYGIDKVLPLVMAEYESVLEKDRMRTAIPY